MQYPRDQYLVQSSLTFLSMTFLKSIHYPKLQRTTIYKGDVKLLFSGTTNNLEQLKIYAETSLKRTKEWYCETGLKMNSNKTQCILFATPNFNKRTETFQITIDDTVRHMEDTVKNLGVIFDSRLSFEHHIKSLCSWLNGTLPYLNRGKYTLDLRPGYS